MMLLALDISLTTGFAFGGAKSPAPRTGVWKLPEGVHNFDRALAQLRELVMMMCKYEKIEVVAIEAAMRKVDREHSEYSAFLLTSLSAVAREAAQRHGARIILASAQKWRSQILGNGNMPGDEAKRAAMRLCDQMRWPYQDNNAAEAAMVWWYGMANTYRQWNPGRPPSFGELGPAR